MLPIGPLMIEHRQIERMIRAMKILLDDLRSRRKADSAKIDTFVQFIKMYADRCHHGKEEDILFRELAKKKMRPEHRKILEELVEEHKLGRRLTAALAEANRRHRKGEADALAAVAESLGSLLAFYPGHIEKEDKGFFIPIMDYFSPEEREAMIREGHELDSRLFHLEYEDLLNPDPAALPPNRRQPPVSTHLIR